MNITTLHKIICTAALSSGMVLATSAQAQTKSRHLHEMPKNQINQKILEHLSKVYTEQADSLENMIVSYRDNRSQYEVTAPAPYYFPLFSSSTYFQAPIHRLVGVLQTGSDKHLREDSVQTAMDSVLVHAYVSVPWCIRFLEDDEKTAVGSSHSLVQEVRPQVSLSGKTSNDDRPEDDTFANDWKVTIRKPNFWKFKANPKLQLMQNHISDNWYKGGESNYSWLVQLNLEATYNNKQKVVFTNTLESKLGFLSTQNDEKHKFRTNADMIRMTNKLGLRATKHWYYTFMLQSWTQFYRGYRSNDTKVYSDFMSPFENLFSIGMDYKFNCKNFDMSAAISPIAANFKYVDRKNLATSFGVDKGKHSKLGYGSNITIKYNWNIIKNISWNGRIYYYTDYSKAQLEWESTFKMKFNKYLTTELFIFPRFDDSVRRKEGKSYIQFKEMLSFGLDISL